MAFLAIVIVFVASTVIFVVQNRALMTMSFLGFDVCAPFAIAAVVVYVLGAITGSSPYSLLRKSVSESQLPGDR